MTRILAAVFWAFAVAAIIGVGTAPVSAQTAKKLKCKGCVGKKQLGKKAVIESRIRDGAVTGAKIRDGSIGPADLAAAAKPTGADSASGEQNAILDGTKEVLRSVTISAPTPGLALVTASGGFQLGQGTLTACSISLDEEIDYTHSIGSQTFGTTAMAVPFSGTRLFEVPAGNTVFNLVCQRIGGGSATVFDSTLTAAFIPNRY